MKTPGYSSQGGWLSLLCSARSLSFKVASKLLICLPYAFLVDWMSIPPNYTERESHRYHSSVDGIMYAHNVQ